MNSRHIFVLACGVAAMSISTGARASIKQVAEAVDCANRCVAAVSGAVGCEAGLEACGNALWAALAKDGAATRDGAGSVQGPAKGGSRPAWLDSPPVRDGFLYGVGSGRDMVAAFSRAAAVISAQISVEVDSSFNMVTAVREHQIESRGRVRGSTEAIQLTQETLSTRTGGVLTGVTVAQSWEDVSGEVSVLAVFDFAAFKQDKQRAIEQLGIKIFDAAWDIAATIQAAGRIGPSELAMMNSYLLYLKERIRDTDDPDNVWRKAHIEFQAAIAGILGCISPSNLDFEGPLLVSARVNRLAFSCNGRPWDQTRFALEPVGVLLDGPDQVVTASDGTTTAKVGKIYGSGTEARVSHAGLDKLPVLKGLWRKSGVAGRLELSGQRLPGSTVVTVEGVGKDQAGLKDALGAFVARHWGGEAAENDGQLQMKATVSLGQAVAVGGKQNVPVVMEIEVREAATKKVLLKEQVKSAALGESVKEAGEAAIKNLAPLIRKMK